MPQEFSLSSALASASSLVFLQFFSRMFTFILNQALVRLVSPQVFGTAAIQFELLLSTILFLSREGVRNALLRTPLPEEQAKSRAASQSNALVTNISLLPVLLGIPAAAFIALIYISTASSLTTSQPHFYLGVSIYVLAAAFELLSEPMYIRAQSQLRFDLRVKSEGVAVVMKSVVAFSALMFGGAEWALAAFALGQAAYGLSLYFTYLRVYYDHASLVPAKVSESSHDITSHRYFEPSLLRLSRAMTGQSLIKHFLTEGDRFLVSRLSPLEDQGGYAVASNYGSLVARILLQPIEETSRVFFSKSLSNKDGASLETVSGMLFALLLAFTHLLLLLATFGPPYLPLAVSIVLPPRYHATSAPKILGTYIFYIPAMAFNGVLEAFFASACAPSDLHAQSRWMFAFSVGFVAVAVGLVKGVGMGDTGLVWANIANLASRALYAWFFVRRFFREVGHPQLVSWRKATPPLSIFVVFALSAVVTRWSEAQYHHLPMTLRGQSQNVLVGISCLIGCMSACAIIERDTFTKTIKFLRRR